MARLARILKQNNRLKPEICSLGEAAGRRLVGFAHRMSGLRKSAPGAYRVRFRARCSSAMTRLISQALSIPGALFPRRPHRSWQKSR
ncbi:hypothetical protein BRAO375_4150012 [Bradyrhizobium sp. ORS 375]|nr:hypothetical protein BRAO375_4150012 [Bradyrhizobium sp. ORS 375]